MDSQGFYSALGVSQDASQEEIKRAYRKLARKHHPDVAQSPESEARFKEISAAFDVLGDPEKRAAYDNPEPQAGGFDTQPDWDSGFGFSHPGAGRFDPFGENFETFFRAQAARQDRGAGAYVPDQHARIELDIEDSYRGATKALRIRSPYLTPDGSVRWVEKDIKVRIPKGAVEGQNIRLKGQHQDASREDAVGDLYLEVSFAPHPIYRTDGRDLHMELPVAPWEAALGQKIVVPTPSGKVDLKLPKNARSEQKLRLNGKGLPGKPPGDIYATIRIVNPQASTREAQKFFENMAQELAFDPRAHLGG